MTPKSSAHPQNSAPAESRHSKEPGLPLSTTVQSHGAKGAALGVEAEDGDALVVRDLETDGWEARQDSDLAALPFQIERGLVLPDEESLPAPPVASASGDVLAAEPGVVAESPEENSLDRGAVGVAVPAADLLHLDEGADWQASQPPGKLASRGASLAQSWLNPLLADSSSPVVSNHGVPPDQGPEQGAHEDAGRLAGVPGEGVGGASQVLCAQREPQAKPVSAAVVPPLLDAGLSDEAFPVSQASAHPPSLESVHASPQSEPGALLPEPNVAAPSALPLAHQARASTEATSSPTAPQPQPQAPIEATSPTAPQAQTSTEATSPTAPQPQAQSSTKPTAPRTQAPVEAAPSPTAPQLHPSSVAVSPSTERKSLAEAMSSPAPRRPLYPKVPVLESPVEGKFQPMSTEQLQQLYHNPELQANAKFVEDFVLVSFSGLCS